MAVTFAFQGVRGAYSEQAALKHFEAEPHWRQRLAQGEPVGVPCRDFATVVRKVAAEEVDCGFLPVENSLAGNIDEATDLLVDMDVHVVGEVELRIRHCLLARRGTQLSDVRVVHSHPQGLRQCSEFLAERPDWRLVSEFDTAGSAALVAEGTEPGHAAIASELAGAHYGLEVLAAGIESTPDNYTRFFCVSRADLHPTPALERLPPNGPGYKTSLIFATRHRPGALYDALGVFARREINLTKLESRPRRVKGRRWEYLFYVDCDGHAAEPQLAEALAELARTLSFLKVLGSFPAAVRVST
jgi:prephenate dehydratase